MKDIVACNQALEEIESKLFSIQREINYYEQNSPEDLAIEKIEEIKGEITDYLQKMSSILIKVCKLSNGVLVVSGGNIVYNGRLNLPQIDLENVQAEIANYQNVINAALKKMSTTGVKGDSLTALGVGLHTLYEIYSLVDGQLDKYLTTYKKQFVVKQKELAVAKRECEKKKKELTECVQKLMKEQKKLFSAFGFDGDTVEKEYVKNINIHYAINDIEVKTWNLNNDGILALLSTEDNVDAEINFIKALTIKFLYSYPNLDKQVLYLSKKTNDDMNNFLSRLQSGLSKDIFFSGIQRLDSFEFDRDLTNAFSLLKQTLEERSSLLDKEGLDDILEYNQNNPNDVKPPIFVVLNNYPFGFERAIDLDYFFENGKKAGVYFLVIQSKENLKLNAYSDESMVDPRLYCAQKLKFIDGEIIFNRVSFNPLRITTSQSEELISNLAKLKKKEKKVLSYVDLGFGKQSITPSQVKESISIPIGKIENKTYEIEFAVSGKDEAKPIAYLLIGAPMMGKSSLIDSMIFNGCMKYSPDDLEFYLIDFKDGVSSATYALSARMPHIKVLAESSKQEEAEIILKTLIKEQTRRNNIFKKHNCKNLADYNAAAKKHLPRIIVVIDEVQKLFKEDSSDYSRAERLAKDLEQIVREARSVGIHVVLASQDASRKMMSCVGKFVPGRFCFGAALEDAENILTRENAKRVLVECNKPGIALVSHNSGVDCAKIKLGYHESKESEYAASVRKKWKDYPVNIAIVGEDGPLYAVDVAEEREIYSSEPYDIPIGQSFYDHSISNVSFNNYNHSLMILGENEKIQGDILKSIMIGALRLDADVMLLDESREFELQDTFGGHPNVKTFEAKTYLQMLKEVYAEYKKRSENRREKHNPYFVIMNNLSMVNAFVENTKLKQSVKAEKKDDDLPDWYDTSWKSGFDEQDSDEETTIYGAETFYEILSGINKANNFYLCFSIDKAQVVKRNQTVVSECDYKIIHAPFVESMSNVVGNIYKNSIAASCNENLILFSEKGQSFMKIRYFKYSDDRQTFNYIRKLGR